MRSPTIPDFEVERLLALHAQAILDTDPEEGFDAITRLASKIFDVPIALVSLVADNRQWFKSRVGLDACETSREVSFCAHAVSDRTNLVIEDALTDPRFHDNPLVTGDPKIRFYAGVLIHGPDPMLPLGTLCIIDREPRTFGSNDLHTLELLAQQVEAQLELRTALRDLASATEAKFRLLANVGHELRTPLNGILGMQQLLDTTALDEEQREYVELLGVSGNYLNWTVDNLMTAALGETGDAEFVRFDLRELVTEVCNLSEPEGSSLVKIRSAWPSDLVPHRMGDPNRIRETLLKLVDNAVTATASGEVVVEVASLDADRISIRVQDPGVGIPSDRLEWIFEEFNQIVPDGLYSPPGLGLGLSVARRYVRDLGGEILVESELGSGSTFRVEVALPPAIDDRSTVGGSSQNSAPAVDEQSLAETLIMRRT